MVITATPSFPNSTLTLALAMAKKKGRTGFGSHSADGLISRSVSGPVFFFFFLNLGKKNLIANFSI